MDIVGIGDPRFDAKIETETIHEGLGPCWTWTASRAHNGYGQYRAPRPEYGRRVTTLAHRHAYRTLVGPVPTGLELDHLCRNRACVNPAHLEAVTHTENLRRAIRPRKPRKTLDGRPLCSHGHPMTGANVVIDRGQLRCRECKLQQQRAWKARARIGA